MIQDSRTSTSPTLIALALRSIKEPRFPCSQDQSLVHKYLLEDSKTRDFIADILNRTNNDPSMFANIELGEEPTPPSCIVTHSKDDKIEIQTIKPPAYDIIAVKMFDNIYGSHFELPSGFNDNDKDNILSTFKELDDYVAKENELPVLSRSRTMISLVTIPILMMAAFILFGLIIRSIALAVIGLGWGCILLLIAAFVVYSVKTSERNAIQIRCDAKVLMIAIFCYHKNLTTFANTNIAVKPGRRAQWVEVYTTNLNTTKVLGDGNDESVTRFGTNDEAKTKSLSSDLKVRYESQLTIQSENMPTESNSILV